MSVRYVFNFSDEDFTGKFDGQPVTLKAKEGRYMPGGAAGVIADQLIDRAIMGDAKIHSRVHDADYRVREFHPRVFTKHDHQYKDELEKAADLGLRSTMPDTVSTADMAHAEEIEVIDELPEDEVVETEMPATPKRKPGRPPKVLNEDVM